MEKETMKEKLHNKGEEMKEKAVKAKEKLAEDGKQLQEKIVEDICGFAAALGFNDIKTVPSSILGGDGNKEFLMHFSLCGD